MCGVFTLSLFHFGDGGYAEGKEREKLDIDCVGFLLLGAS
jgi:hypothetical protein